MSIKPAFEDVVDRHSKEIFSYLCRMMGDHTDAEDCLQEVFLRAFYPEVWKDFNVTSPGMALVDLNAYVSDLLSNIADKKYNENYLEGVQERKSVYRLAKTFGYKPPGFRPAITVTDMVTAMDTDMVTAMATATVTVRGIMVRRRNLRECWQV